MHCQSKTRIARQSGRGDSLSAAIRRLLPILQMAVAVACTTAPTPNRDLLVFLNQETVTKEETVSLLGQPHETFEEGRVFTYRLGHTDKGYYLVPPAPGWEQLNIAVGWEGVDFDLVLVFDESGVLHRQRLVAIRSPAPSDHGK